MLRRPGILPVNAALRTMAIGPLPCMTAFPRIQHFPRQQPQISSVLDVLQVGHSVGVVSHILVLSSLLRNHSLRCFCSCAIALLRTDLYGAIRPIRSVAPCPAMNPSVVSALFFSAFAHNADVGRKRARFRRWSPDGGRPWRSRGWCHRGSDSHFLGGARGGLFRTGPN